MSDAKPETASEAAPALKTYKINYKDKDPLTVQATSVAWTENGLFILLMEGETPKHVVVAANVIAVTEA
jgi:hypothetical protein